MGAPCPAEIEVERRLTGRVSPRILVVDDEPAIRDLLEAILCRAGYEVDVAPDGVRAMDFVRNNAYALLIADVRMPRMDGFEFYNAARVEVKRLPVLFITGVYDPEIRRRATEVGALGFLFKPFQVEEILKKVENLVALSAAGEGFKETWEETSTPIPLGRGGAGPAYQILLEAMEEGIVLLDPGGIMVFTNPRFLRILKNSPGDLVGRKFLDLISPDRRDAFRGEANRLRKGETRTYETVLRNGPREIPVLLRHTQTGRQEEGTAESLIVVMDLGPLKEAEKRIQELSAELRWKVQELEVTRQEVREVRRAQTEITHLLHRELQSPLGSLVRSLMAVAGPGTNALSPSQRAIVEAALRHGSRVQGILEEMKRLSKWDGISSPGGGS